MAEDPLTAWARVSQENAEVAAAEAMLRACVSTAASTDRFATWLLAGTAAAAALIIVNLDGLLNVLTATELRTVLFSLLLSVVIGLVGKGLAAYVQIGSEAYDRVHERLSAVMNDYDQIKGEVSRAAREAGREVELTLDAERVVALIKPAFPRLMHGWLDRSIERGAKDRLHAMKRLTWLYFYQSVLVVVQLIPALVALCVAGVTFDVQ